MLQGTNVFVLEKYEIGALIYGQTYCCGLMGQINFTLIEEFNVIVIMYFISKVRLSYSNRIYKKLKRNSTVKEFYAQK